MLKFIPIIFNLYCSFHQNNPRRPYYWFWKVRKSEMMEGTEYYCFYCKTLLVVCLLNSGIERSVGWVCIFLVSGIDHKSHVSSCERWRGRKHYELFSTVGLVFTMQTLEGRTIYRMLHFLGLLLRWGFLLVIVENIFPEYNDNSFTSIKKYPNYKCLIDVGIL